MTYATALCLLRVLLNSTPNEEVRNSFPPLAGQRRVEDYYLIKVHTTIPLVYCCCPKKKELKVFVKDAVSQMDLTDKKPYLIQEGQRRAD